MDMTEVTYHIDISDISDMYDIVVKSCSYDIMYAIDN